MEPEAERMFLDLITAKVGPGDAPTGAAARYRHLFAEPLTDPTL